jgi:hypothetical protein
MTGAHLVVEQKVTPNHQVIGVTFQIRGRKEGAIRSSVFEIDIGTEIPLVRRRNEADANSAGVDLAVEVGIRHFEDFIKAVPDPGHTLARARQPLAQLQQKSPEIGHCSRCP